MRIAIFPLLCLILVGCQNMSFPVANQSKNGNGLLVRRVVLVGEKPLVCYAEIENDVLSGVSCQNNLSVTLFSAGRIDGKVVLHKTVPFFSKNKVKTVIHALTLALFTNTKRETMHDFSSREVNGKVLIYRKKAQVAQVEK